MAGMCFVFGESTACESSLFVEIFAWCSPCPLFSKADVHMTNIRVKLGSAFGHKRTCLIQKIADSSGFLLNFDAFPHLASEFTMRLITSVFIHVLVRRFPCD